MLAEKQLLMTAVTNLKSLLMMENNYRVKKSLSEGALRPSDLLAHFKQIQPTTRSQIWAAELLDNTVELIREMVYTHTMVQASPHGNQSSGTTPPCSILLFHSFFLILLLLKELLSADDVENLLQVTGCSAELQRPSCASGCLSERYRSITGECNNRSVLSHTHTHTHTGTHLGFS